MIDVAFKFFKIVVDRKKKAGRVPQARSQRNYLNRTEGYIQQF